MSEIKTFYGNTLADTVAREDLSAIYTSVQYDLEWGQGTISTANGVVSDTILYNRIYSDWCEVIRSPITVTVVSGYKFSYRLYASDKTFISSSSWLTGTQSISATEGQYLRFVAALSDDSDLTPDAGANIVVTRPSPTDITLTKHGKAADAYTVGVLLDGKASAYVEDVVQSILDTTLISRYTALTKTQTHTAYCISPNGSLLAVASGNNNYKVDEYAVTSGGMYQISGSAYGNKCIYSFCDTNGTPIAWYNADRTQTSGFYDMDALFVCAPYGATKLYVSYVTNHTSANLGKAEAGWRGLKWAAMGDSITDANNERATKRYFDYISDATGISVVNLGKSGTGYKKAYNSNLPFYQRVDTVPTDSDVITIFGSGNDCSQTLGTPTDATADTVCGCINLTIDGIRDRILGANLGIITPTPWVQYPTTTVGNKMDLYCDAIIEICRLKGVPCLDLYHCSNMLPWEADFRTAYYKHDDGNGVHPDEDGHKLFAPKIKAFLNTLLM